MLYYRRPNTTFQSTDTMFCFFVLGLVLVCGQSYATFLPNNPVACRFNNINYRVGDRIATPNQPCFICQCFQGWTKPCVSECAQIYCPRIPNNCRAVYVRGQCCPTWNCQRPNLGRREATICEYNGKTYMQGDPIPTPDRPCFKCSCREGWREPSSTHCAIVDCPFDANNHENCTPTYQKGQCCPSWECSQIEFSENKTEATTCEYDGKTYMQGDSIPTPDQPCFKCSCREGWTGPSLTHCATVDCPFDVNFNRNCTPVYQEDECCPSWECPQTESSENETEDDIAITCEYNGKNYSQGEEIPTPDKPCIRCSCYDGWTGPDAFSCAVVDCPFEENENKELCVPIYDEGECCPRWECPTEETEPITCEYNGKTYSQGEEIPTPDKPCFKCSCHQGWTAPNALSCAIVDCPFDENENKELCVPVYDEGECCPRWKCPIEKREAVTCEHNGQTYKEGDKIPTPDKPCFKCICSEGWTKPDHTHCAIVDCPRPPIFPDCHAIFEEGKCCPSWSCPSD